MSDRFQVNIYTDGSSRGNPGPGGYGIILESPGFTPKEISQGFKRTTNNRMELLAVIEALRAIKKQNVDITVYSDSKYVVDAVEKGWVFGWHKKGFLNKKNPDLWRAFIPLYQKLKPKMVWIKGHNEHPQNERCDKLAVAASKKDALLTDIGFEESENNQELF